VVVSLVGPPLTVGAGHDGKRRDDEGVPTPSPRPATNDDLDGIVATLAAAFRDDPLMAWALPDPASRERRLAGLWRFMARRIYLAPGASTTLPDHEAVALWLPAGVEADDAVFEEHLDEFLAGVEGDAERLGVLGATMGEAHPHDRPHWYLLAIGAHPVAQGRGLGSALLAHTLALADERHEPAYLEATTPRSRALYQRMGFAPLDELTLPDGPPVWPMWRDPA